MNALTEKAMLVRQAVNVWSGRKFDKKVTREVLDHHNAQTDAGRWNKSLVARAALADVNRVTNLARTHHYDHTLSWEDWGARILPAAAYFDYMNEQRGFKTAFDAAADAFERNYVQYVSDAKAALNGMFDADDYPDVYDIRSRFAFETIVSPLSDSDDFRVNLNASEVQRIQADIESRTRNILHDATDECWKRLYKSVEHMTERLSDADNRFCQWRSKKGPPWRCKKGPLGGCGLVPVVHGRAPRATRRALNRPTRRRAREGPVGPRGQAWAGWSVQFAVGV